jgi:hypothetical protein
MKGLGKHFLDIMLSGGGVSDGLLRRLRFGKGREMLSWHARARQGSPVGHVACLRPPARPRGHSPHTP